MHYKYSQDNEKQTDDLLTFMLLHDRVTTFIVTFTLQTFTFKNDSPFQRIPFNISWQPTAKSNFFLNTRFNSRDYGRSSSSSNLPDGDLVRNVGQISVGISF